ncbi:MAG: 50S ribosomal protein L35 [Anaerolineales bacterium]|jgi:large subunit ribosomal protein L35|nr:50S ribosomal protein L35 [Anaerolineales bacterium]
MGKKSMKTHKATAKRFRVTGSGKIMRMKGHHGHFRRRKSKQALQEMDKMHEVDTKGLKKRIKRLAPNLGR